MNNKSLIFLPLIAIPIIFILISPQDSKKYSELDLTGQDAILKVGEDFIKQASIETLDQDHILNGLREITEEEIRKETQIHDPTESEKIFTNGMKLSDDYNRISFEYSAEKLNVAEFFSKLLDFKIKYEKYVTAIDSYIGDEDILVLKNSMVKEYKKINEQITLIKNSGTINDEWESQTEFDKYKKYLPSMFDS
jgi:competence protein ComGC